MNRDELTLLNIGDDLDTLMNLDPRGYGVCRILYEGSRAKVGEPLSINAARGLIKNVKKGESVEKVEARCIPPEKLAQKVLKILKN